MPKREQLVQTILPYIIGFGLSRLMEYPIRTLLVYPLGFLFQYMGFISAEENRKALQEVHQVYLYAYVTQLRSFFYWTLWLGMGAIAGVLVLLGKQVRMSPRAFNGFTAVLIILGTYGCIIGFRGFPFGWAPMDFIGLPVFIIAQFYVAILFTRWVPSVYRFLNETRVENLLARRR